MPLIDMVVNVIGVLAIGFFILSLFLSVSEEYIKSKKKGDKNA